MLQSCGGGLELPEGFWFSPQTNIAEYFEISSMFREKKY